MSTETAPRRRVVVTGMGAITPLGNGVDALWNGCLDGRSGIRPIDAFDASALPCHIAGQAWDFDPRAWFSEKESRRYARFTHMALAAADEALQAAGLDLRAMDEYRRSRAGVVLGNGSGGAPLILKEQSLILHEKGWPFCDPFSLLKSLSDMGTAVISSRFGATGYMTTIAASCASGSMAIGHAADAIRAGRADVIIAGGSEAWLSEIGVASFALLRALSGRNDEPERASRPFDRDRDGFVPAEGAAALVLESEQHAVARGAPIIGEVKGFGTTSDAHHLVAPLSDGSAAGRAITQAMEDAGLNVDDIDYISAHGTSTSLNDVAEVRAIERALGESAGGIPVSATKSLIGHSLGASAAIEAVVALKTIEQGIMHATANLDNPDPRCNLRHIRGAPLVAPVSNVLSLNFAFGGQNTCLVLGRYD
jgi:3-oxoacyl-[acyl-carrier-protein] synthase II